MKRLRFFLLSACPVLLLIAVGGGWLHVQHRQYALDRQLITALDYNERKQEIRAPMRAVFVHEDRRER
ncbi:MAG: hypothetical protein JWL77_1749 [Chthonomonadaceae bacterium]|nr:hypothetical protein [Chthonomonadaceae bacterium]